MNCLTHPGGDKQVMAAEAETEALVGAEATRFRAVAARANYLSGDRPDIQYAVKEICRRMAKPVKGDWEKLIRLGRYLKGAHGVSSATSGKVRVRNSRAAATATGLVVEQLARAPAEGASNQEPA